MTPNPGLNGPIGPGWYFHFYAGSPATFKIRVDLIPVNRTVLLALKYPTSTTFAVKSMPWESCANI